MGHDALVVEAEKWIGHLVWVSVYDDPVAIANEAARLMRGLLEEREEILRVLEDQRVRWKEGE